MYKYRIDKPFIINAPIFDGVVFKNEWLTIGGGMATITEGYCWDGCSPKANILGVFELGVPDGLQRQGLPWLYHASLVHDVLCQYRDRLPFTKNEVTALFNKMMVDTKWPLAKLYTRAVDKFGPQDFVK
jgi:hypothetical protein